MFRKKWRILSILFTFTLLFTMPDTIISASNDVDIRSSQQISDTKKVWTIAFSQPLKESSVKRTTVYVEDEHYRLFFTDVTLSEDKKSIIVTPRNTYQENQTYRLHISKDVTSEKGKKLEGSIVLPFSLNKVDQNGNENSSISKEPITNVTITPQAFASRVTAISNDIVNRVTANGKDMHYEGNNTYSMGLTGVDSGDTVGIKAYDINNKLLFSKGYKVN